MEQRDKWIAVDDYITGRLLARDPSLDHALETSTAAGLPPIAVSPPQGKLLYLLARMHTARRILEIGTLGGYSTIWLARALPADGMLVTLESDANHADVARANIAYAGLSGVVDVRLGLALDTLPHVGSDGPFDLTFIDADKQNIPAYFDWAVKFSRPGSVIIVDNVVRDGAVLDDRSTDPNIQGVRRFNEMLAGDKRVTATTIQTVGVKGYDGFSLAIVEGA